MWGLFKVYEMRIGLRENICMREKTRTLATTDANLEPIMMFKLLFSVLALSSCLTRLPRECLAEEEAGSNRRGWGPATPGLDSSPSSPGPVTKPTSPRLVTRPLSSVSWTRPVVSYRDLALVVWCRVLALVVSWRLLSPGVLSRALV